MCKYSYRPYDSVIVQLMEETIRADQLISCHRNRPDYVPSPENSLQLAFGDLQYSKFYRELESSDDVLKLKVLKELNDSVRLSNNTNLGILSSDIVQVLLKHISNEHDEIRELSSRAMTGVCMTSLGKDQVLFHQALERVALLLDDKLVAIRGNAYNAFLNYSATQEGKDRILNTSILPKLIKKLIEEKEQPLLIKDLVLIRSLLEGEAAINQLLTTTCITDLLGLLPQGNQQIRQLVINNLAAISFNEKGKSSIISKDGVVKVCPYIEGPPDVVEAATICLASLAQMNQGKDDLIAQGQQFLDKLIELLDNPSEQIVLNTVQLLGNVAEHPAGRKHFQKALERLKSLKDIDEEYRQTTIDVIEWKP